MKTHPSIDCNAHRLGNRCGHLDELVGREATILRPHGSWSGRIEWVGRWDSDGAVASLALRIPGEPYRHHFGLGHRTTLIVSDDSPRVRTLAEREGVR